MSPLRYQTLNCSTLNDCDGASAAARGCVVHVETLSDAVIASASAPAPVHARSSNPASTDRAQAAMTDGSTKWEATSKDQCTERPQNPTSGTAQRASAARRTKLTTELMNFSMAGSRRRPQESMPLGRRKVRALALPPETSGLTLIMLTISIIRRGGIAPPFFDTIYMLRVSI